MNIDDVVEEVNEKHMAPWGELCRRDGVANTPLTPYIEKVNNTVSFCYPLILLTSSFPFSALTLSVW